LPEHLATRGWLNYLGDDQGTSAIRDAYGPNYDRLVELKRTYDARTPSSTTTTSSPEIPVERGRTYR
jgi:berberine-like enzyme